MISGCLASPPAGTWRPQLVSQQPRRTFGFTTQNALPPRRDRLWFHISFPSHATPEFQTRSGSAAAWTVSVGPLP